MDLLRQIKDIRDELQTMLVLHSDQMDVIDLAQKRVHDKGHASGAFLWALKLKREIIKMDKHAKTTAEAVSPASSPFTSPSC